MAPRSLPLRALLALFLLPWLAVPAQAQRDSDFMRGFRKLVKGGDLDAMAAAVEAEPTAAMLAAVETCELVGEGSSDELEADVDALSRAWRKAFDTRFVNEQYEFHSLMAPDYRRARRKLIESYQKELVAFESANEGTFPAVGLTFKGLMEGFEEVGDRFYAGQCAKYYAVCFEEETLGRDADLRRVCEGLGKAQEHRRAVKLPEALFADDQARFEQLEHDGFGDFEKSPEGRAAARMEEDPSYQPHPLGGTFEMLEDLEAVQRPFYGSDGIYLTWDAFPLGGDGSKAGFPALQDSPSVIRLTAAKAAVDVDRDGEGDVEFPATGNLESVVFDLGRGDAARKWGFLAITGKDQDTYQGIQPFYTAPSTDAMSIYVAPGASLVGMVGETRVQVFDDNMDARYGSPPLNRALFGMVHDSAQADVDSIWIGDAKRALPWSQLVQVEGQWHKFFSSEDGTDIIVQKWEVETGRLKLKYKGPKVDYLILQGEGHLEHVYLDIAADSKGIDAPVGSYHLFTGRVGKGKRLQKMKALVVPGAQNRSWRVTEGETTEVELGAPFSFDFSFSQNDDVATVDGSSIVVVGQGGETYQRLWNCIPHPEASARAEGSKKGGKATKLRVIGSQLEANDLGLAAVWFPLDGEVKKKKSGPAEVQLFEKKNKLFGKIESDWKAE